MRQKSLTESVSPLARQMSSDLTDIDELLDEEGWDLLNGLTEEELEQLNNEFDPETSLCPIGSRQQVRSPVPAAPMYNKEDLVGNLEKMVAKCQEPIKNEKLRKKEEKKQKEKQARLKKQYSRDKEDLLPPPPKQIALTEEEEQLLNEATEEELIEAAEKALHEKQFELREKLQHMLTKRKRQQIDMSFIDDDADSFDIISSGDVNKSPNRSRRVEDWNIITSSPKDDKQLGRGHSDFVEVDSETDTITEFIIDNPEFDFETDSSFTPSDLSHDESDFNSDSESSNSLKKVKLAQVHGHAHNEEVNLSSQTTKQFTFAEIRRYNKKVRKYNESVEKENARRRKLRDRKSNSNRKYNWTQQIRQRQGDSNDEFSDCSDQYLPCASSGSYSKKNGGVTSTRGSEEQNGLAVIPYAVNDTSQEEIAVPLKVNLNVSVNKTEQGRGQDNAEMQTSKLKDDLRKIKSPEKEINVAVDIEVNIDKDANAEFRTTVNVPPDLKQKGLDVKVNVDEKSIVDNMIKDIARRREQRRALGYNSSLDEGVPQITHVPLNESTTRTIKQNRFIKAVTKFESEKTKRHKSECENNFLKSVDSGTQQKESSKRFERSGEGSFYDRNGDVYSDSGIEQTSSEMGFVTPNRLERDLVTPVEMLNVSATPSYGIPHKESLSQTENLIARDTHTESRMGDTETDQKEHVNKRSRKLYGKARKNSCKLKISRDKSFDKNKKQIEKLAKQKSFEANKNGKKNLSRQNKIEAETNRRQQPQQQQQQQQPQQQQEIESDQMLSSKKNRYMRRNSSIDRPSKISSSIMKSKIKRTASTEIKEDMIKNSIPYSKLLKSNRLLFLGDKPESSRDKSSPKEGSVDRTLNDRENEVNRGKLNEKKLSQCNIADTGNRDSKLSPRDNNKSKSRHKELHRSRAKDNKNLSRDSRNIIGREIDESRDFKTHEKIIDKKVSTSSSLLEKLEKLNKSSRESSNQSNTNKTCKDKREAFVRRKLSRDKSVEKITSLYENSKNLHSSKGTNEKGVLDYTKQNTAANKTQINKKIERTSMTKKDDKLPKLPNNAESAKRFGLQSLKSPPPMNKTKFEPVCNEKEDALKALEAIRAKLKKVPKPKWIEDPAEAEDADDMIGQPSQSNEEATPKKRSALAALLERDAEKHESKKFEVKKPTDDKIDGRGVSAALLQQALLKMNGMLTNDQIHSVFAGEKPPGASIKSTTAVKATPRPTKQIVRPQDEETELDVVALMKNLKEDTDSLFYVCINNEPRLEKHVLKEIFSTVEVSKKIKHLSLAMTGLIDADIKILARAIRYNEQLETLNLESNIITQRGLEALMKEVGRHPSLREIKISNQKQPFGGQGEALMADAIHKNENILKFGYSFKQPGPRNKADRAIIRHNENLRQRRRNGEENVYDLKAVCKIRDPWPLPWIKVKGRRLLGGLIENKVTEMGHMAGVENGSKRESRSSNLREEEAKPLDINALLSARKSRLKGTSIADLEEQQRMKNKRIMQEMHESTKPRIEEENETEEKKEDMTQLNGDTDSNRNHLKKEKKSDDVKDFSSDEKEAEGREKGKKPLDKGIKTAKEKNPINLDNVEKSSEKNKNSKSTQDNDESPVMEETDTQKFEEKTSKEERKLSIGKETSSSQKATLPKTNDFDNSEKKKVTSDSKKSVQRLKEGQPDLRKDRSNSLEEKKKKLFDESGKKNLADRFNNDLSKRKQSEEGFENNKDSDRANANKNKGQEEDSRVEKSKKEKDKVVSDTKAIEADKTRVGKSKEEEEKVGTTSQERKTTGTRVGRSKYEEKLMANSKTAESPRTRVGKSKYEDKILSNTTKTARTRLGKNRFEEKLDAKNKEVETVQPRIGKSKYKEEKEKKEFLKSSETKKEDASKEEQHKLEDEPKSKLSTPEEKLEKKTTDDSKTVRQKNIEDKTTAANDTTKKEEKLNSKIAKKEEDVSKSKGIRKNRFLQEEKKTVPPAETPVSSLRRKKLDADKEVSESPASQKPAEEKKTVRPAETSVSSLRRKKLDADKEVSESPASQKPVEEKKTVSPAETSVSSLRRKKLDADKEVSESPASQKPAEEKKTVRPAETSVSSLRRKKLDADKEVSESPASQKPAEEKKTSLEMKKKDETTKVKKGTTTEKAEKTAPSEELSRFSRRKNNVEEKVERASSEKAKEEEKKEEETEQERRRTQPGNEDNKPSRRRISRQRDGDADEETPIRSRTARQKSEEKLQAEKTPESTKLDLNGNEIKSEPKKEEVVDIFADRNDEADIFADRNDEVDIFANRNDEDRPKLSLRERMARRGR